MTHAIRCGSICAGIAGFDLAFARAGAVTQWHSEIDPSCNQLLHEKLPKSRPHGDLAAFKPNPRTDAVDVVFGGTPCQDLSVAGQRAGLDGERSGLFYQMVRVCKRLRPRIVLWENVPGALSSNSGNDFACILRAFTGLKVEVPADGWGNAGFVRTPYPACRWNVAWRVLDAQYFGVAQRRRRVFLVGSLGDASCLEILFEPESVCGDSPPSRETGQRAAPTVEGRAGRSGANNFATSGGLAACARSLRAQAQLAHREDVDTYVMAHGQGNAEVRSDGEPSLTCNHEAPILAKCISGERDGYNDGSGQTYVPVVTPLLEVGKGTTSRGEGPNGCGIGEPGDPMFTLQRGSQHAIAFEQNQRQEIRTKEIAGSQSSIRRGDAKNETLLAFQPRIARNGRGNSGDKVNALQAHSGRTGKGDAAPHVASATMVRRLTPTECERLQGFPDCYTQGYSDSTRYRMLGNSVAVPCVEWIARRIVKALTP